MSIEGTAGDIHIVYDRECPGKVVANELLFLTISKILALFEISKARDIDGNEIMPSGEYSDGAIRYV